MPNPSYLAAPHAVDMPGRQRGVLLVNLGTPDGTDYWSMRRYLKEFLSDRRVVDTNRLVWWFVLNFIILTFRPTKSGHAYAAIWDKKRDASPLRVITEAQAAKLQKKLGKDVVVRFAMRYGQPAIRDVLDEMYDECCTDITIVPLYPQYAGATVGTVVDEVGRWLARQATQPTISYAAPYYDDAIYIAALAEGVKREAKGAEVVVASFHGLPLRFCVNGDVYYCHCHKTARLLAEKLGFAFCRTVDEVVTRKNKKAPALLLSFQSTFGREEWLQPYTAVSLEELAKRGVKNVAVVCPGFSSDCVETLEEMGIGGREIFMKAGGKTFGLVRCLNDSAAGMKVIERLVEKE